MAKFYIRMKRDTDEAKKLLGKIRFMIFDNLTKPIYEMLIRRAADMTMKEYNPQHSGKCVTYSEENEDLNVLIKDKEQLEEFLFSDCSEFKKQEQAKKALANRMVRQAMKKLKNLALGEKSVLAYLAQNCIFVEWGIVDNEIPKIKRQKRKV